MMGNGGYSRAGRVIAIFLKLHAAYRLRRGHRAWGFMNIAVSLLGYGFA